MFWKHFSNNSTTTQMKANTDKWKQTLWQKNKTLAIAFMKNFLECFLTVTWYPNHT